MDKRTRVIEANRVIDEVASCGRGFFGDPDGSGRVGRFELGHRGVIWWRDAWGDRRVYIGLNGEWRGFHGGGTLQMLVRALRDYIRTGKPISPYHFGPWSWTRDHWGYGPDMDVLRCRVARLQAVATWTAHSSLVSHGRSP